MSGSRFTGWWRGPVIQANFCSHPRRKFYEIDVGSPIATKALARLVGVIKVRQRLASMRQQDRQFQVSQDARGGTAHHEVAHAGMAEGTHDHHVGTDLKRMILQRFSDRTAAALHLSDCRLDIVPREIFCQPAARIVVREGLLVGN